jgi:hypothetical protein
MRIRRFLVALTLLIAVGASAVPASADNWIVDINIQNISDTWAWITIYSGPGRGIMTSGCVNPESDRTFTIDTQTDNFGNPTTMPYEVRAEITHKGCAHPVYVDKTLGWARGIEFYVRGNGGNYSFGHTP